MGSFANFSLVLTNFMNNKNIVVEFKNIHRNHHCDFRFLPKDICAFLRQYFACLTIEHQLLDSVVLYCEKRLEQELLANALQKIQSTVKNYRGRKCHRNALKYIIDKLEERNIEINSQIYHCLTDSMIESSFYVYRIYFDQLFTRFLTLRESQYQLSHGTTGLSCWQASCDLANYLSTYGRVYVSGSDVLELGAGCGLVSIAIVSSGLAKSITSSDGNETVLNAIRNNIKENFTEDCNDLISIIFLEWENFDIVKLPVIPNVIIASDVVYDLSTIKPLVNVIRKLLIASSESGSAEPCCIIANTLRNQDTMDEFLICADKNELVIKECFFYENNIFTFADCHVKDESLFPFKASVQCPTIFHKLILKCG